ncbi:hypothetical protein [Nocardiopsis synnemataformans]
MHESTEDLFVTPERLEVPDQVTEYTKTNGDGDMPNRYDEI